MSTAPTPTPVTPSTVTPTTVTPSTEEVRLATTMTGGVSLAVWMGGVAREIDLVMQASRARQGLQSPAEQNLYIRLLELLDIVVDVDVLSGTSAGGINAVLLAYARAHQCDLSQLRDLWLDLGALLDLLRDPTDTDAASLLYGDRRMLTGLNDALRSMKPAPGEPIERPSTTLYVTTTLLTGESSRFTDNMGTLVQDTNQRGLFTFTEDDLAKDGIEGALALAARSTASFPGAFEPSFIPFETPMQPNGKIPARPAMKDYANITRDHWAADGGLLNNQPLDVLLERIFDRPAASPVRRVLLYVVPAPGPSPDLRIATPGDKLSEPYGLLGALLKDLTAATSQSISASLRAIVAHNDRISARAGLRLQLIEMARRLPDRLLTPSVLGDYRGRESERQARKLVTAMLQLLSTWPPQTRATPIGIPTEWQAELKPGGDAEQLCRQRISDTLAGRWPGGVDDDGTSAQGVLPDTSTLFAQFGQSAYDNGKSIALAMFRLGYQAATTEEDRTNLTTLVEQIHSAATTATRPSPAALAEATCRAAAKSGRSLTDTAEALATDWANRTCLDAQAWANLGAALHGAAGQLAQVAQGTPEGELSTYARYLGLTNNTTCAAEISMRLFDLAIAEKALLPEEAGPYQRVELVQLSADTRSLLTPGNPTAASKLTGLQFHHFGAFYKKSWRANDWMWGRLDAAGWLVYTLLDPRRLKVVAARQPAGNKVAWLVRELESLGAVPLQDGPASDDGVPTRTQLEEELAFLDDATKPVPQNLVRTSLWVATAWQRDIAAEELPNLARVITGESGKQADDSPRATRTWARKVLEEQEKTSPNFGELLKECPVPKEKFTTDMGSPLMMQTVAKAAATTAAAVSSIRQIPGPVRPVVTTARTITLGGYRIADITNGGPRFLIIAGMVLLALGIAAATQSYDLLGFGGLAVALLGGYLMTIGAWQTRVLTKLAGVTLTCAAGSLAAPVVRQFLFGTSDQDPGYAGRHMHWLATAWWHPLLVVGILLSLIIMAGAAFSQVTSAMRRGARTAASNIKGAMQEAIPASSQPSGPPPPVSGVLTGVARRGRSPRPVPRQGQ